MGVTGLDSESSYSGSVGPSNWRKLKLAFCNVPRHRSLVQCTFMIPTTLADNDWSIIGTRDRPYQKKNRGHELSISKS